MSKSLIGSDLLEVGSIRSSVVPSAEATDRCRAMWRLHLDGSSIAPSGIREGGYTRRRNA